MKTASLEEQIQHLKDELEMLKKQLPEELCKDKVPLYRDANSDFAYRRSVADYWPQLGSGMECGKPKGHTGRHRVENAKIEFEYIEWY